MSLEGWSETGVVQVWLEGRLLGKVLNGLLDVVPSIKVASCKES